jgi:hypothetical protein
VRPEDLFPDGPDSMEVDGIHVRKGSIASFIYNALTLDRADPSSAEYERALAGLREMAPVLNAVHVFEVFSLRSQRVAAVVREVDPQIML